MPNSIELIEQLRRTVGAQHVLTEGDLSAYEQDWRRRRTGKALAVVRPANTAEVAAVVKACAAASAPIVPQGGWITPQQQPDPGAMPNNTDPLRYEKRLLNDWVRRELQSDRSTAGL